MLPAAGLYRSDKLPRSLWRGSLLRGRPEEVPVVHQNRAHPAVLAPSSGAFRRGVIFCVCKNHDAFDCPLNVIVYFLY